MYLIEVNNDNTFCKCTTFGWNRLDLFCVSIHYIDEIKTILYKIKKTPKPFLRLAMLFVIPKRILFSLVI